MQGTLTLASSPNLNSDELAEDLSSKLNLHNSKSESESEEDDFSFICHGGDASPIAAEDAFHNGQIRPAFPLFNREIFLSGVSTASSKRNLPPVRKFFADPPIPGVLSSENEGIETVITGSYCNWSRKAVEASPEMRKKSHSTGFSKLWRIGEAVNRSKSDGRDAFVYLNASREEKSKGLPEKNISGAGEKMKGKGKKKGETASLSSAHEMHYVRNRAMKEEDRKRSYLPYKPDLVGFFTNVNGGLSRNLHVPF